MGHLGLVIAQTTGQASGSSVAAFLVVALVLYVFYAICGWKVFTKAGQPGWAALIPIYNTYIVTKIVGRPGWWVILTIIPYVNIVFTIILAHDLSKSFGHGGGFTVGLVLLGIVFLPILAFGSSTYRGPSASSGMAPGAPWAGGQQYPQQGGWGGPSSGPGYGAPPYGGQPGYGAQPGFGAPPGGFGTDPAGGGGWSTTDPAAAAGGSGAAAAAWHPDPTGRHQLRYWNGSEWTEHVSDNGVQATDPV